ncbi:hypothetical protein AKJ16_DCAP15493 [Drosera capensis]
MFITQAARRSGQIANLTNPRKDLGKANMEDDGRGESDGFKTPKRERTMALEDLECPPAPKKKSPPRMTLDLTQIERLIRLPNIGSLFTTPLGMPSEATKK